jgi:hypothetical protein
MDIRRSCMTALIAATALVSSPAAGHEQDFVLICVPKFGGKLVPWGCRYATQGESQAVDQAYGLATLPLERPGKHSPRIAKKKAAQKASIAQKDRRRGD